MAAEVNGRRKIRSKPTLKRTAAIEGVTIYAIVLLFAGISLFGAFLSGINQGRLERIFGLRGSLDRVRVCLAEVETAADHYLSGSGSFEAIADKARGCRGELDFFRMASASEPELASETEGFLAEASWWTELLPTEVADAGLDRSRFEGDVLVPRADALERAGADLVEVMLPIEADRVASIRRANIFFFGGYFLLASAIPLAVVWFRKSVRKSIDELERASSDLARGVLTSPVPEQRFADLDTIGRQLERARVRMLEDSEQIEMIERISAGLISAESIQDVADVTSGALEENLRPDSIGIFMPTRRGLEAVGIAANDERFLEYSGMVVGENSIMAGVYQSGRSTFSADPANDPRISPENRQINRNLGVRAYMAVPLRLLDRTTGVLALTWTRPTDVSDVDLSTVELAAAHIALALDRILHVRRTAESSARDRAILYSIGEGLVTTDRVGHVVLWNRVIEEMSGISEGSAVSTQVTEVLRFAHPDGSDVARDEHPFVIAARERQRVVAPEEGLLLRCGDDWMPVALAVAPVMDGATYFGSVGVIRDIRRERELEELRESLISTVSHELRTPLTMVQGFAELLLEEELSPDDQRLAIGQIVAASNRLADLIDDILSTAAIESGRLELVPEWVDVADLLDRVRSSFAPPDADRIVVSVPEGLGMVMDPDRIEQVLTNLVSNAIKYSPEGGEVRVTVTTDGDEVEFAVADEGIGMSAEEKEGLFGKFHRGSDERVRHIAGTGLGLYICKSLVDIHGGSIHVESYPEKGSTFTVRLPIKGSPVAGEDKKRSNGA